MSTLHSDGNMSFKNKFGGNLTLDLNNISSDETIIKFPEGNATLLSLNDFKYNFSDNGYAELPGGLILQWGRYGQNGVSTATVQFPIVFPTKCLNVNLTNVIEDNDGPVSVRIRFLNEREFSFNNFVGTTTVAFTGNDYLMYMAIGY